MPVALSFFSGGFFDEPRLWAGLAAWTTVLLAALASPRPLPRSTAGRLAVAGLGLLCAWTALSIAWSPVPGRAQDDVQRLLLYLGAFVAATAVLQHRPARRALGPALVLGILLVVGYGLAERLLPTLIDLDSSAASAGRLEQPLTYWNALGLVAAIGVLLAMSLAGDGDRRRALRAAMAAAGVPLGLGLYLSFSRGALAATALGLLVLLALAPDRRAQLRSILATGGAGILAALVANAYPTVTSLDERDAGDGLLTLIAVLALSVAAAFLVSRPPSRRSTLRTPTLPNLSLLRPKTATGIAVTVVVLSGLALAAVEGGPESASPTAGAGAARLGSIDSDRYRYWEVAATSFLEHPLKGVGSGGFLSEWLRSRESPDPSRDAHSLYLESASELGVPGLVFLLFFLGAVAAAVIRAYQIDPRSAAGLAACLAAWGFHAGLDWDWEMPAVTLPVLLLAASATAVAESTEHSRGQGSPFGP